MVEEKNYLIGKMVAAGVKNRPELIYTTDKRLKASGDLRVGAVLREAEELTRTNRKAWYEADGKKMQRTKIFERITKFKVVIGDATEENCEDLFYKFIADLDKGILIDGNWEEIEVTDIDWVPDEDSLLKSKLAVQFIITFTGGIYKDNRIVNVTVNNVTDEIDTGGEF